MKNNFIRQFASAIKKHKYTVRRCDMLLVLLGLSSNILCFEKVLLIKHKQYCRGLGVHQVNTKLKCYY